MAQAAAPGAAALPEPPQGVLAAVLRRVTLRARCRCACVCRTWACAVAEATEEISLHVDHQRQGDSLGMWLARPGRRVARLHVSSWHALSLELPAQCLAQLRELEMSALLQLRTPPSGSGSGCGAPQLTRLVVGGASTASVCAALQPLSALSGLRELSAGSERTLCVLGPQEQEPLHQLLAHATQLTALQAQGAACLDQSGQLSRLTGLRQLRACLAGSTASSVASLLAALAGLRQLQHLQLRLAAGATADPWQADPWQAAPAEQYAALTASSQLTQLRVECWRFAAGAARHMFGRPGQALPHLRVLAVGQWDSWSLLDQAGLASLVACCPALERLELGDVLPDDSLLTPLAQLASLSRLSLVDSTHQVPGAVSDANVGQLAACTGLRSLCVRVRAHGVTHAGALALTRLVRLTSLTLGPRYGEALSFHNKALAGTPPDVWQQLREHCEAIARQQADQAAEAEWDALAELESAVEQDAEREAAWRRW